MDTLTSPVLQVHNGKTKKPINKVATTATAVDVLVTFNVRVDETDEEHEARPCQRYAYLPPEDDWRLNLGYIQCHHPTPRHTLFEPGVFRVQFS